MKKRILSILLSVVMLVSVMPLSAITAQAKTYSSGIAYDYNLEDGDRILTGVIIRLGNYNLNEYYTMANGRTGTRYLAVNHNDYTATKCLMVDTIGGDTIYVRENHVFDYNNPKSVITPANCQTRGKYIYTCQSCKGDFEASRDTYGDHIYGDPEYVAPTCIAKGYTIKKCTVDGCKNSVMDIDEVTPLAEHTSGVIKSVESTKEAPYSGYEEIGCTVCGKFDYGKAIDENGVSYNYTKEWVTIPNSGDTAYPESEHNYSSYTTINKTISYPNAVGYRLTFDERSKTESNYDKIFIKDENGKDLVSSKNDSGTTTPFFSGTKFATMPYEFEAGSLTLKFTSDSSTNDWGFAFSKIEAAVPALVPTSEDYSYLAYTEYNFVVDGETPVTFVKDEESAEDFAFKTSMQRTDNIFLGWTNNNKYIQSTKNVPDGDILSNFRGVGTISADYLDEKQVSYYSEFGLAGVQIREDNTQEVNEKNNIYGGLRFVASFGEELLSQLNIIEYGFVVASKDNADANAIASGDKNTYVIKNGDKDVHRIKCSDSVDHRRFSDYRLFTFVIDYEGNEALKNTEFVARPYIAYRDNNGVARIFYGSYDGTVTYGGCSTSYNNASVM